MESYKNQNIFVLWFVWHFYQMPVFLFSVWRNYLEFSLDFFSAPLLLATLFYPWRKYSWRYPRAFDVVEYANTFISNVFSRILGAACRLVLIIASIFPFLAVLFLGVIVIAAWLVLPIFLVVLALFFFNS